MKAVRDMEQLGDIIADALVALGIKEADVYGASMGGMIAQEMAIHHPELVRSLMLASSMSRNNEMSGEVFTVWSDTDEPSELSKEVNTHVYSSEYYHTYEDIFHALERSATPEGVSRLHELVRLMQGFSACSALEQIGCPVYVFAGSCDNTLSAKALIEIAEKLGCFLKVHEGYSHAVYDENPGFYDDVFANLR